jgi:O-acetylhomoserine/O-acetylserine sulfhydrylase-like pyridoxal-dependent enzyme
MSTTQKKYKGFSSLAIHAGQHPDPMYAHLTPIYASSTYVFDDAEQGMRRFAGQEPGYIYSRWGNPTMNEAEEKIAAMETFDIEKNGEQLQAKAILHASGMAAISSGVGLRMGLGGFIFMMSDTMIGASIAKLGIPYDKEIIIVTYLVAQFLIITDWSRKIQKGKKRTE